MINRMVFDIKINGYPNPTNEIQTLLNGLAKQDRQLKNNKKLKKMVKQAKSLSVKFIFLIPKLNMLTGIE